MASSTSLSQVTFGETPKVVGDNPHHLRLYLERMRNDTDTHDVIFVVDGEKFPAQRSLVCAASPVLRSMLTNGMKESKQMEIELKEVDVNLWKSIVDYIYAAHIEVVDVNYAMKVVECANRFQVDELVQDLCECISESLHIFNCCRILSFADRNSLTELRKKATDFAVNNFNSMCYSLEFRDLSDDIILEIMKSRNLDVRGEIDLFNCLILWLLDTDDLERENEVATSIAKRAYELLKEIDLSLYGYGLGSQKMGTLRLMQSHGALLRCIDVDNLINVDRRRVGRFCVDLLTEAKSGHNIEPTHIQELSDRIFRKFISSPNLTSSTPVLPLDRLWSHRYCESITFRYRFHSIQKKLRRTARTKFQKSAVFQDRNRGINWWLEVHFRDYNDSVRDKIVSCYVRNECRDSEWKEEEVNVQLFVVTSTNDDPMEPPNVTKTVGPKSVGSFENTWGCLQMQGIRVLDGKDSIAVGFTIYIKRKRLA